MKLKYDEPLENFAFDFNLLPYVKAGFDSAIAKGREAHLKTTK